ncbi:MAG: oligosaccharide flippase family protein [Candidatus Marinimicrobia bacterium]|nr:oligosaccharide flippase family protein [Candidatus Neomarinimicrobiota bacterium]
MQKDIKNLVKHSSIYTLGNILTKSIGIVLIPVYTKHIPVSDFGVYAIFLITAQIISQFLMLGLDSASLRWYSIQPDRQGIVLFSGIVYSLLINLILALVVVAGMQIIPQAVSLNSIFIKIIYLMPFVIGLDIFYKFLSGYIWYKEYSVIYAVLNFSNFAIQLLSTVIFVAVLKIGILGIFLGQVIGFCIVIPATILIIHQKITVRLDIRLLFEMIKYGWPLSLSTISNNILEGGDRYLLSAMSTMAVVGCYDLGYKFASLIKTLIINSFHTALKPMMWNKLKDENFKEFHTRVITYYTMFTVWISLFLSVFAKGIIKNFVQSQQYWESYKIVGIVTFAVAIKGLFPLFRIGFEIQGRTNYIPAIVTVAGVINIMLNIILIPQFGMLGAALSTFISFSSIIVIAYLLSVKIYYVNIEWKKLGRIFLTVLLFLWIAYYISSFNRLGRIVWKSVLLACYPFVLYWLGVLEKREVAFGLEISRQIIDKIKARI